MAINARAPFILCREALPHLNRQPRANIVNIASALALKGCINEGAYSAAKHALLGMSKTLARELQGSGTRVHVVYPGGVDTGMREDENREDLMHPEAIADAVVFLITRKGNSTIDDIYVRRDASIPWS